VSNNDRPTCSSAGPKLPSRHKAGQLLFTLTLGKLPQECVSLGIVQDLAKLGTAQLLVTFAFQV